MKQFQRMSNRPSFSDIRFRFCSRVVAISHWVAGMCLEHSRQKELMRLMREQEAKASQCDMEREFKEQAVVAVNVLGGAAIGLKERHERLLEIVHDVAECVENSDLISAQIILIQAGFISKKIGGDDGKN